MEDIPENRNVDRTVQIGYTYNLRNRSGSLKKLGNPEIHVEYAEHDVECHKYTMQLSHPNYLSLMMVHEYGNVNKKDGDKSVSGDILVHKKPRRTYEDQVKRLLASKITPVMLYSPGGETHAARYYYVPQQFRMLVRGAVDLLLDIHEDGRALKNKPLTLNNLQIGFNELVMCGVEFQSVTSATKDERFKQDWFLLQKLINQMFEGCREKMSVDLCDLLRIMSCYHSCLDDRFLRNHLALMTSSDRVVFVMRCYDHEKSLISMGLAHAYVSSVTKMGNNACWIDKLISNPIEPVFDAVTRCFNYEGVEYTDNDPGYTTNHNLLRCARNMAVHLKDNIDFNAQRFGDHDIDNMLMSTFGKELIAIHQRFRCFNLLKFMIRDSSVGK